MARAHQLPEAAAPSSTTAPRLSTTTGPLHHELARLMRRCIRQLAPHVLLGARWPHQPPAAPRRALLSVPCAQQLRDPALEDFGVDHHP